MTSTTGVNYGDSIIANPSLKTENKGETGAQGIQGPPGATLYYGETFATTGTVTLTDTNWNDMSDLTWTSGDKHEDITVDTSNGKISVPVSNFYDVSFFLNISSNTNANISIGIIKGNATTPENDDISQIFVTAGKKSMVYVQSTLALGSTTPVKPYIKTDTNANLTVVNTRFALIALVGADIADFITDDSVNDITASVGGEVKFYNTIYNVDDNTSDKKLIPAKLNVSKSYITNNGLNVNQSREFKFQNANGTDLVSISTVGNTTIHKNFDVNNKFTVASSTGNTVISGSLETTGTSTLNNNLTVGGSTSLNGTLDVSGNTSLNNADFKIKNNIGTEKFSVAAASGNTVIQGTLSSIGEFKVNNNFTVDSNGDVTIPGTLGVTGQTTVQNLTTTGTTTIGPNTYPSIKGDAGKFLKTDGAGVLSWDTPTDTQYTAGTGLNLTGTTFSINSSLNNLNDVVISNPQSAGQVLIYDDAQDKFVNKLVTAGTNVTVTSADGSITISSQDTLYTAGTGLNLNGTEFSIKNSEITSVGTLDNLTVTGTTTLNGGLTLDNFTVSDTSGNTTIGGTLNVTGDTTLGTTTLGTTTSGALSSGNFQSSGTGTFAGSITAAGASLSENVSMAKKLTVNGTSSFKNTTVTGTFGVTENSSFDKNLSVGDNLTVSENFFIIGGGLRFTDSGNVPDYTIDCFAKTDGVRLPVGTSAQRPTNNLGVIRFNTSLSKYEGYDGTVWKSFGDLGNTTHGSFVTIDNNGNVDFKTDNTRRLLLSKAGKLTFYTSGLETLYIDTDVTTNFPTGINDYKTYVDNTVPITAPGASQKSRLVGNLLVSQTVLTNELKSDNISSKTGTIGTVTFDANGSVAGLTNLNIGGGLTTTGNVNATKGIFTGDVSGVKGTFTGEVSGSKGTFTDIDVDSISAKGGNSISINSNWSAAGQTCTDLGTVTTVDINGGTMDNVSIGSVTPGSGKFTTLTGVDATFSSSLKIPVVNGGASQATANDEGKLRYNQATSKIQIVKAEGANYFWTDIESTIVNNNGGGGGGGGGTATSVADTDGDTTITFEDPSLPGARDTIEFLIGQGSRTTKDNSFKVATMDQTGLQIGTSVTNPDGVDRTVKADDFSIPDPNANNTNLSLGDLMGPPKAISGLSVTNSSVDISASFTPVTLYNIGFITTKVPVILALKVKFENTTDTTTLIPTTGTHFSITGVNYETLNKIVFSKQAGTNGVTGTTYTFYNLNLIQGKEYKITLGYTNNHPEIKAITDGNNTLAQAQAPDTITTVIFTEPTTTNGSISTTVYNETGTPKVSFSWTQPLPRSGNLSGYDVTYQAVGTSLNTLDYSADEYTTTATAGATSINITNNVKFGTKYKVKIRASNDAGATGQYSAEFTSAAFTKVPNRPSSTSITLTLRNSSTVSYNGTSLNGFYYYNGNNFTTGSGYLLNSTQFGNNIEFYTNTIKVVENLRLTNTIRESPGTWTVTGKVVKGALEDEKTHTISAYGYVTDVNFTGSATSNTNSDIVFSGNLTTDTDKFWPIMNINTFYLKFKNTMATLGDGTITLKVDAPLDTTGTLNFSVDTLNTVPTIDATKSVKLSAIATHDFNCGLANLKAQTGCKFLLTTTVQNLATNADKYYRNDRKQLLISNPDTTNRTVRVNDITYGKNDAANSGNQIVYTDKDVDVRLTNANKIGLTFFTLTAYNIKGTSNTNMSMRIYSDNNSRTNTANRVSSGTYASTFQFYGSQVFTPSVTTDNTSLTVTAAGGKFSIGGVVQKTLTVLRGTTYTFNVSDSSNSTHVLRFSTTSNGTHGGGVLYTTGVSNTNNPGTAGATVTLAVNNSAPDILYYYCTAHSGMGGMIIVRSSATSPFSNTQALGSNELLLINGLYESFNNVYYIDYSNYNTGLTNATTNLTSHTGVDIGGTDYLFATFTITPTGTWSAATSTLNITIQNRSGFSRTSGTLAESGLLLYVWLPSAHYSGESFWYNANASFDREDSFVANTTAQRKAGLIPILNSRSTSGNNLVYSCSIPANTTKESTVHVRIGLKSDNSSVKKFSGITLSGS